jgi:hypothetical protein
LSGNPCTKDNPPDYKLFVVAYLKDLKYLDYEVIDADDRNQAMEKYREEIQEKEQQKAADKGDEDRSSINREFLDQLREAKIECTEDVFLNILKIDDDNQKLKYLPKY